MLCYSYVLFKYLRKLERHSSTLSHYVLQSHHLNKKIGSYLGPVFPSPIKSNLISDLLISDQLDVQNWSSINCVSFFHGFSISNYMIGD